MEFLIFNAASLLALALFVAACLLPAGLLFVVRGRLGRRWGRPSLRWALPLAAAAALGAWSVAGLRAFEAGCRAVPAPQRLAESTSVPAGFAIGGHADDFGGLQFAWGEALRTGSVHFVDVEHAGRYCIDPQSWTPQAGFTLRRQCDAAPAAPLQVRVLAPRRVPAWWRPPLHEHVIELVEAPGGRVLARATDLVFGGGWVAPFLGLAGGDADFGRLSCGYASAAVGPWRPTLTSRPRFQEYLQADLRLLGLARPAAASPAPDARP